MKLLNSRILFQQIHWRMSNMTLREYCDLTNHANQHSKCIADNITSIPRYHNHNSMSYQISRCNYCGKQWDEFWLSYKYIFSSLIDQHLNKQSKVYKI